jgi:hypothetical protein
VAGHPGLVGDLGTLQLALGERISSQQALDADILIEAQCGCYSDVANSRGCGLEISSGGFPSLSPTGENGGTIVLSSLSF